MNPTLMTVGPCGMDTPTPADLVAHVVALPADEARALLVALLRARPDEAVGAARACHALGSWDVPEDDISPVTRWGTASEYVRAYLGRNGTGWWLAGLNLGRSFDTRAEAQADADAALLADGWVLASGGSRG